MSYLCPACKAQKPEMDSCPVCDCTGRLPGDPGPRGDKGSPKPELTENVKRKLGKDASERLLGILGRHGRRPETKKETRQIIDAEIRAAGAEPPGQFEPQDDTLIGDLERIEKALKDTQLMVAYGRFGDAVYCISEAGLQTDLIVPKLRVLAGKPRKTTDLKPKGSVRPRVKPKPDGDKGWNQGGASVGEIAETMSDDEIHEAMGGNLGLPELGPDRRIGWDPGKDIVTEDDVGVLKLGESEPLKPPYGSKPWQPSVETHLDTDAGRITMAHFSTEGHDLLDRIMQAWVELPKSCKEAANDKIYQFAYWLVRHSGLIRPVEAVPNGNN